MACAKIMEYQIMMKLYEKTELFRDLVQATAEQQGLPEPYIEKDFWVTLALRRIANCEYRDHVVFKGGTSLSKAYQMIQRFSEDIDLAVIASDLGDARIKRILKNTLSVAGENFTFLEEDDRNSKGSKFRKQVYQYPTRNSALKFGQATPELLVEINAFTRPSPFQSMPLRSLITSTLEEIGRKDLIGEFDLGPFHLNVLEVNRTLVEKILGIIKDSYSNDPVQRHAERIRHIYDITMILRFQEYRDFLLKSEFHELCRVCLEDERTAWKPEQTTCFDKPLSEAPLFESIQIQWSNIEPTYTGVFAELVYAPLPKKEEILDAMDAIRTALQGFDGAA